MAETKIEWTHRRRLDLSLMPGFTFNAWIGCQPVGPECDNCYAESQNKRRHWVEGWGPHGERKRTSSSNWKNPPKWNRAAAAAGEIHAVFSNSLSDVFDNQAPDGARAALFQLIEDTPNLVWLLLTKRPQNIIRMVEEDGIRLPSGKRRLPRNAALGTSAGTQKQAHIMVPHILRSKAALAPAFAFVSSEPLLEEINFLEVAKDGRGGNALYSRSMPRLDWVIAGGESGPKARFTYPKWARSIRNQCAAAGVPYFWKQWGEFMPGELLPPVPGAEGTPWRRYPDGSERYDEKEVGVPRESMPMVRFLRVGKGRSGRMLDGVEWSQWPEIRP